MLFQPASVQNYVYILCYTI